MYMALLPDALVDARAATPLLPVRTVTRLSPPPARQTGRGGDNDGELVLKGEGELESETVPLPVGMIDDDVTDGDGDTEGAMVILPESEHDADGDAVGRCEVV